VSDFVQGGIIAIASALLGYWAAVAQSKRERRERRVAIATALLTELRWLERILRKLAQHNEAAASTVRPTTDVHDEFQSEFLLFGPETLRLLLYFRGLIRDIELSRENIRAGLAPVDGDAHHFFRVKAAGAASLIPELRRLLEGEGGASPLDKHVEQFKPPSLPSLPPPAFPDTSG
jgi:hypothetical protein